MQQKARSLENSTGSDIASADHHCGHMVDLLVGVALADGRIGGDEERVLHRFIPDAMGTTWGSELVARAVDASVERCQNHGVDRVVVTAGRLLKDTGDLALAIRMAVDVASAMEGVCAAERRALTLAGLAGGIDARELESLINLRQRLNSWADQTAEWSRPPSL